MRKKCSMKTKKTVSKKTNNISMESYLIHGIFRTSKWDYDHNVVPPLSASVTYRLESVERGLSGFEHFIDEHSRRVRKRPTYVYDRLDEPTRSMLEERLAIVESGEIALCYASGMAAISAALMVSLKPGDELLIHKTMYGCTFSLTSKWLPRYGIITKYIDMLNLDELKAALNPNVKAVYFETPANPNMELIDIEKVVSIVDKENAKRKRTHRIRTIVDNTFATPRCQRPLEFGVTMVVDSLTKNIGGFGTDMGGAVITSKKYEEELLMFRKDFGGVLGSRSAWHILVYGLPTLIERGNKQQDSSYRIAAFLEKHPKVGKVMYPGLPSFPQYEIAQKQMRDFDGNFAPGNMIYFTLKNDTEESSNKLLGYIAKKAYSITLAVSLGHIRTLIEKPGSLSHAAVPEEIKRSARIDPSGIRLSIGLENPDDIIADFENALKVI